MATQAVRSTYDMTSRKRAKLVARTVLDGSTVDIRICKECGEQFRTTRKQDFCSDDHNNRHNNRRKVRGAAIMPDLMRLRFDRKNAAGIWGSICAQVTAWHYEDVAAGRSSW